MRGESWNAIGTTVHLLVMDDATHSRAVGLLRTELAALDVACSRFRSDSELRRLRPGRQQVSPLLEAAVRAALEAAEATDGLVDPTMGRALAQAGYDRTFSEVQPTGPAAHPLPSSGRWREIHCGAGTLELPDEVLLDLGATAKAWAADRAAHRIWDELGTGVLVNLGGDLCAAGPVPPGGWVVDAAGDVVTVSTGGLATSSTSRRTWQRGGRLLHHVLDPRTGTSAATPWATATVAASTCLAANTASTAALVLGATAPEWLAARALPARLVGADGTVVHVGGWPVEEAA